MPRTLPSRVRKVGKIVKAKIEEESLKFLVKMGLVSHEQVSAGAKTTDKENGE